MTTVPTPLTDLKHRVPEIRAYLQAVLTHLLGPVTLADDFYREWNGTWRVRVTISGPKNGTLDCVLLETPAGGVLALPRPFPESWRTRTGMQASDGSVWTLSNDGNLVPFPSG